MSDSRLVWTAADPGNKFGHSHNVTQVAECNSRRLVLDRRPRMLGRYRLQGIALSCLSLFILFGDIRLIAKGIDFLQHPPFVAGTSTPTDLANFPYPNMCFAAIAQIHHLYLQSPVFVVTAGLVIAMIYLRMWDLARGRVRYSTYAFDRQINALTITRHYSDKLPKVVQYSLGDCQGAIVESQQINQFWLKCRVVLRLDREQILPLTEYKVLKRLPTATIADTINEFLSLKPSIEG
jgi:hypothetical protein